MTRTLLFGLVIFLSSCSQQWHCKKCLDGGKAIRDTLIIKETVYTPVIDFDTVVHYDLSTDTLIVQGPERIKIKFRDLPGPTVYIAAECPPDSVVIEKSVPVITEVKTGFALGHLILAVLAGAGAIMFLFLFRKGS